MNRDRLLRRSLGGVQAFVVSAMAVSVITLIAAAGSTSHGRPAGVPPQPTRPVVAPPTEHPPVVATPPVSAPPVEVPSHPEQIAGAPTEVSHPPFSTEDLIALLNAWGSCVEGASCEWDLNGDGVVNRRDLVQLVRQLD